MEYRRLGNSGLKVSLGGLGCMNFGAYVDEAETKAVVHKALDAGINFFDTADVYGNGGKSEEFLGRALGPRRKEVLIGTKFGVSFNQLAPTRGIPVDISRRHLLEAVEGSLKRLGTDYLDLYTVHWPDPERLTPLEEVMEGLDALVRAGKVRYVGHSNFSAAMTTEAHYLAETRRLTRFIAAQNPYSLLDRAIEAELIPYARRFGVGVVPYFPIASGLLAGRYKPGTEAEKGTRFAEMARIAGRLVTDENLAKVERLTRFAEERGHTILELAMSWLGANPAVSSIIAGCSKPEQVSSNAAAIGWKLTPEDTAAIDRLAPRSA